MNINGQPVNFDRKVYLTIAKNSAAVDAYAAGQNIAGKSNSGIITLVFDPQLKREYCPRIDAVVSQVGRFSDRNPANATARISVWNLGSSIRQFLDGYNAFNESGVPYNMVNAKKSAIVLQVGYGNVRHTIFRGWIGSFNVVRQQTEDTVDNIWQFYCAYPGIDVPEMSDSDRAVSGIDYLSDSELEDFVNTAMSPELQLREIVYRYPRTVYVNAETQEKSIASFLNNLGLGSEQQTETNQTLVKVPQLGTITPENFNDHYVIKYVSDSHGTDPNNELKKIWQRNQAMYPLPVDMTNLEYGIDMLAIQLNCRARLGQVLDDGRQEILIWRAGTNASSSKNWVIKNFQNVLQPPQIGMGGIVVPIMLEPDIRPMDSLELQIDDSFTGMKLPSFISQLDRQAYAPFVAGNNFSGVGELATPTNAKLSAKYGNIFFKRFNISHVEHSISTHSSEWKTTITTRGPDMNALNEQAGL